METYDRTYHSCEWCKYNYEDENGPHCKGCVQNATDNYKMKTNADAIKDMSDYGLASFLSTLMQGAKSTKDLLIWLRSEYTGKFDI